MFDKSTFMVVYTLCKYVQRNKTKTTNSKTLNSNFIVIPLFLNPIYFEPYPFILNSSLDSIRNSDLPNFIG